MSLVDTNESQIKYQFSIGLAILDERAVNRESDENISGGESGLIGEFY